MNITETTSSNWMSILEECLNSLDTQYPKLNDSQRADKISIPRATFNRIKNEKKLPSLENVIKLVIGSGNLDLLNTAISFHDDNLANSLNSALSVTLKEKNKVLENERLEQILRDEDVFVSYLMASVSNGLPLHTFISVLGEKAKEALHILIESDIIEKRKNESFKVVNNGALIRSFSSLKHHISTYAKHYKIGHVGKNRNYIHSLSDGLNTQGISKVQELHKEFHEKLQQVYRNDYFKGEIPSFSVAFCDTFTNIELDNAKGVVQ